MLQLSLLVASHFSVTSRPHFGFAVFNVTADTHTGYSYIGLIRKHTRIENRRQLGKLFISFRDQGRNISIPVNIPSSMFLSHKSFTKSRAVQV